MYAFPDICRARPDLPIGKIFVALHLLLQAARVREAADLDGWHAVAGNLVERVIDGSMRVRSDQHPWQYRVPARRTQPVVPVALRRDGLAAMHSSSTDPFMHDGLVASQTHRAACLDGYHILMILQGTRIVKTPARAASRQAEASLPLNLHLRA